MPASCPNLPDEIQPSIKFTTMARRISKIDNVLKAMQQDDEDDRLKLR